MNPPQLRRPRSLWHSPVTLHRARLRSAIRAQMLCRRQPRALAVEAREYRTVVALTVAVHAVNNFASKCSAWGHRKIHGENSRALYLKPLFSAFRVYPTV